MRLKRQLSDFRVSEVLNESGDLLGPGPWSLYRVTKRGLTTPEAVGLLAEAAGVPASAVEYAGLKDKDAVTSQFMTVLGGRRVKLREDALSVEWQGTATRALQSGDNLRNSFELVLRDLSGDDMRRVRVNLLQVRNGGLPAYFDDQRFGSLRHGQGFIVRKLLRGDVEGALRDLFTAPSPYGDAGVERYKAEVARRWGNWDALVRYARGGRGASLFEYLHEHPDDFIGAFRRGISTSERTIHLFAYQSHLWNHAAALWIRGVTPPEQLGWLPSDDGALPVHRVLDAGVTAALRSVHLPLFGRGMQLSDDARRYYESVFRAEGVDPERFLALDVPGFRPQGEDRPLLCFPEHARAAPAERDDIYKERHKMRLRFHLPRGQYATLVAKRLLLPTERAARPPKLWISRHCQTYPDAEGQTPWQAVLPAPRDAGSPRPPAPRPKSRGGPQDTRPHD